MEIQLENRGDVGYSHLLKSLLCNAFRRVFPSRGFFLSEEESFFSDLPLVCFSSLVDEERGYSLVLLSLFSPDVERFFHEMVSRWFLPGKKIHCLSFIHTPFFLSKAPLQKLSFCEMRFFLSEAELELAKNALPQLESDLKLGSTSPYHAQKILEHRGVGSSQKSSLIHENINALIQKRPDEFDYDVFGQMQHFLISSREEFRQMREPVHLSRIIALFYIFRKHLRRSIEKQPDHRHILVKLGRVRIHHPLGLRKNLGVFVGLNFLKHHELFEEHHLLRAVKQYIPDAIFVEGSFFLFRPKEEKIQMVYLEVQKELGMPFSADEMQALRRNLPEALEHQIEKLMPTLFMPRNEEEVMKNIIRLGQELKYLKDIPQVFISFEEQTDLELMFTVVLLRVLLGQELPLQQLFSQTSPHLSFVEDRVKSIGWIRKKYQKEATVFRVKLPKGAYLRRDHSVDLLQARQAVVAAIDRAVGEFRDYNGGMLAKQLENLQAFQCLFPSNAGKKDLELEVFFHAL
ncbi:MAG: hypothetical protein FJZ58_07785, partial [Chlamydiae bacterium]|nr:hypothetical protein [Chlamydiota bacterium]